MLSRFRKLFVLIVIVSVHSHANDLKLVLAMNKYEVIGKLLNYLSIADQFNFCNALYEEPYLRPCLMMVSKNIYCHLCGLKIKTPDSQDIENFESDNHFEEDVLKGIPVEGLHQYHPKVEINVNSLEYLVYCSESYCGWSHVVYAYGQLKGGDVFYATGGVGGSADSYDGSMLVAPGWADLSKHLPDDELFRLLGELVDTKDNSCFFDRRIPEQFSNNLGMILCGLLFSNGASLLQYVRAYYKNTGCLDHFDLPSYIN